MVVFVGKREGASKGAEAVGQGAGEEVLWGEGEGIECLEEGAQGDSGGVGDA